MVECSSQPVDIAWPVQRRDEKAQAHSDTVAGSMQHPAHAELEQAIMQHRGISTGRQPERLHGKQAARHVEAQ